MIAMAGTQKRKFHLDGADYEWCIRGNDLWGNKETRITIYKVGVAGRPIHLDPYVWALEIAPRTIGKAVGFALENGWVPESKGPPFRLGFVRERFVVLPEGIKNSKEWEEANLVETSNGIRFLPGEGGILAVAPHGPVIDDVYENDKRTGVVAERVRERLGCCALINDRFVKPAGDIAKSFENFRLDLFRIDHGGKVLGYLERIREVVAGHEGKTLVLWVHGISDEFALMRGREHVEKGSFAKAPEDLHALVGFGQGGDPKTGDRRARYTAARHRVEKFCESLTAAGMNTIPTHPESSNYRGRDSKRLNQWFVQSGYGLDAVESIQLEIRERGFRDTVENAKKCGDIVAQALSKIALR